MILTPSARGGRRPAPPGTDHAATAMPVKDVLAGRLRDRTAVIGIVVLGYVGLPLLMRFSEIGFRVVGFDIDDAKVAGLNAGRSFIEHIPDERVAAARASGF